MPNVTVSEQATPRRTDGPTRASLRRPPIGLEIGVLVGVRVIRVRIAIEVAFYREGLAIALGRMPELTIVDAAADTATVLRRATPGEVVLLESAAADVLSALRALHERDVKTVVLGIDDDGPAVVGWAESGASGYVTRASSIGELALTIEAAARGELRCSPQIAGALLRQIASRPTASSPRPSARLTRREVEIAELIEQGLSNKEIAARLVIELGTVKNHVHNILEKVGVARRQDIPVGLTRVAAGAEI